MLPLTVFIPFNQLDDFITRAPNNFPPSLFSIDKIVSRIIKISERRRIPEVLDCEDHEAGEEHDEGGDNHQINHHFGRRRYEEDRHVHVVQRPVCVAGMLRKYQFEETPSEVTGEHTV